MLLTDGEIKDWLRPLQDPELNLSLVELGLIYSSEVKEGSKVKVNMTLTTPTCPAAGYLVQQVKDRLLEHKNISEAEVELVWEPKWTAAEMASEECKEAMGIW